MKILFLNNYHFIKGGSERVYFEESELLREHGHSIRYFSLKHKSNMPTPDAQYFGRSMEFESDGMLDKMHTSLRIIYSLGNNRNVKALLNADKIDIAHAHNIYHRVNPSVFKVLKDFNVPIFLTLHDYKLACATYNLYRNDQICTQCIENGKMFGVLNKCTKGSLGKSLLHYIEGKAHDVLGLYRKNVNRFICPSEFSMEIHRKSGLPENKLVHIPNFIRANQYEPVYTDSGYGLFVGRLSREKGVLTMLKAIKGIDFNFKIVGDGPKRTEYEKFARENGIKNVEFEGYKSGKELNKYFQECRFLVFPSECYENAPMTILEAFAFGKPIIASRIGGVPEMITEGETGLLYQAGDEDELRGKLRMLISVINTVYKMGRSARHSAETTYSAESHYKNLISVYEGELF